MKDRATAWLITQTVVDMCGAWLRLLLALALRIAVTASQQCGVAGGMTKIVGGESVGSLQHPWYVALVSRSGMSSLQVSCGGSLITRKHVLSAAHCFSSRESGVRPELMYRAVLGLVDRCSQKDPDVTAIASVRIHPNFDTKTLEADVAVITLERAVSYTPVCLPPKDFQPSGPALVIGFGSTLAKSPYPCTLQRAQVKILSRRQCTQTDLSPEYSRLPGTICAGVASGGVDSCDGDSGGPIMTVGEGHAYIVQGIVSFGEGCARRHLPGVYTQVSAYRNFIDSAIGSFSAEDFLDGEGEGISSTFIPLSTPASSEGLTPPTPQLPSTPSFLDMLLSLLRPWIDLDSFTDSSSGGHSVTPSVSGGAGNSRPLSLFEHFLLQIFNRNHRRKDRPSNPWTLG